MKTILSLLAFLILTTGLAEEFKGLKSGEKIVIKFTVKNEYRERHEKVTFLTATEKSVMFEDESGKSHILTKGYINIDYRMYFWKKDWEDHQKQIILAQKRQEKIAKTRELLSKLSDEEIAIYKAYNEAYPKVSNHIKKNLTATWELHKNDPSSKAYQEDYYFWKKRNDEYRINAIRINTISEVAFKWFTYPVMIEQVIDANSARVKPYSTIDQSPFGSKYDKKGYGEDVFMILDTSEFSDGKKYYLKTY